MVSLQLGALGCCLLLLVTIGGSSLLCVVLVAICNASCWLLFCIMCLYLSPFLFGAMRCSLFVPSCCYRSRCCVLLVASVYFALMLAICWSLLLFVGLRCSLLLSYISLLLALARWWRFCRCCTWSSSFLLVGLCCNLLSFVR